MRADSDILLTTTGVVMLLADASSPVMRDEAWATAKVGGLLDRIRAECARDRAFLHTILVDGTFRLQFTAHPIEGLPEEDPTRKTTRARLELPTGHLVVRSAGNGDEPIRVLSVTPGPYDMRIEWWFDREGSHWEIASPADYPVGDGPDGIIELRPADRLVRPQSS